MFFITLKQYTLTGLAVTDNWFILCVLYSFLQILREGKEKTKGDGGGSTPNFFRPFQGWPPIFFGLFLEMVISHDNYKVR